MRRSSVGGARLRSRDRRAGTDRCQTAAGERHLPPYGLAFVKHLDGLAVEPAAVAQCSALAEPMETSPRLLVDVTQTAGSDYLSGIQRVVLNIASRLAPQWGLCRRRKSPDCQQ